MRIARFILVAMLAGGASACSSFGPAAAPRPPQPRRDLLTRDEILSSTAQQGDLFQAIQSLRPQFLVVPSTVHSRGTAATAPVSVYIDRARQMGIQSLRTIAAINVAEVRYLDPTESQNQFGAIASSGAILVKLYDSSKNPDA